MQRVSGAVAAVACFVVLVAVVGVAVPFGVGVARADGNGPPICIDGLCTIGVGTPGGSGTPGGPGESPPPGTGGSGPSTPVCTNTDPQHGCDPCPADGSAPPDRAACATYRQNLFCSELNPSGTGADEATWLAFVQTVGCAGNPYTPPDPGLAAAAAEAQFRLHPPTIHRSPDAGLRYQGYAYTYVQLATWFWTDPGSWATVQKSASVSNAAGTASVTATAVARPVALSFSPGDGAAAVTCGGPGQAWTSADGNQAPSSGCYYRYGEPQGTPITATVSITWQVSWSSSAGIGGTLEPITLSASQSLRVLQVSTVNR